MNCFRYTFDVTPEAVHALFTPHTYSSGRGVGGLFAIRAGALSDQSQFWISRDDDLSIFHIVKVALKPTNRCCSLAEI